MRLIGSPAGLTHVHKIARAHERVIGLLLGSEDFATICRMDPSEETLIGVKQQDVYAARAAGIAPLSLLDSVAAYSGGNLGALAARSAAFVFSGATGIHPSTVEHLSRGFSPSEEDISWLNVFSKPWRMQLALAKVWGATSIDRQMIDEPILDRAKATLARRRGKTAG